MNLEAVLQRKLATLYPDLVIRNEVSDVLASYGVEKREQEPLRIRLAVLKLSSDDVEKIKTNITYAKQDFREVLVWAEYRRQSGKWSMRDSPKKRKIIAAGRAEYEQWLEI